MANFVLIENNEIIEYHDLLPKNWRNVSGLRLLKDNEEMLNELGWYTVNQVPVFYDSGKQYIDHYKYEIIDNVVYETAILKDADPYIPPPEKTPEELFELELIEVRIKRDQLLIESDWTQLADIQASKSDLWKTSWATYRQQLRDLPNQCISGEINIYAIEWPNKPDETMLNANTETTEPVEQTQEQDQTPTDDPNVGE
jgi:hypothetical protein